MKQIKNILVVFLMLGIGFMTIQYIPVFKKSGIKMELVKKVPVSTEEEEEEKEGEGKEKESDPEKKETNNFLSSHGNYRFRSNQCGVEDTNHLLVSYLSAIMQNSTPPPEQA